MQQENFKRSINQFITAMCQMNLPSVSKPVAKVKKNIKSNDTIIEKIAKYQSNGLNCKKQCNS